MTLDSAVQRMADELKRIRPFESIPMHALRQLAVAVHMDFFEGLDALEPNEEPIKSYYLVLRGTFILRQGNEVLSHYQGPAILGWNEAMNNQACHYEVLFTEESVVLEMPVAETRYLMSQFPALETFMAAAQGYVVELENPA